MTPETGSVDLNQFTLNHVGFAVPSIEKFLSEGQLIYGALERGPLIENVRQGVREMFLTGGGTRIELLEPMRRPSPLDSFLAKHPFGGVIHLAFDVDALEPALAAVAAAGGRTVVQPTPDVAFDERRIAFVVLGGQLVEFIERREV